MKYPCRIYDAEEAPQAMPKSEHDTMMGAYGTFKRRRRGGNVDRCWAALLLVIPAASCVETQAPLALGPEYLLTTVNGSPLPFVVDSVRSQGGNFDYRIVGRSIKFLSADSAQYEEASDLVEPLPDGTFNLLAAGCFGVRTVYVAYRSFLVVTIDSNIFHPPTPVAIRYDTLTPSGDTLIYRLVQSDRVLRLAFVPGRPATPVCAPFGLSNRGHR